MNIPFPRRTGIASTVPEASGRSAISRSTTLALVISCAIWGTSFLFGKIALRGLTISQVILLRFLLGSITLLPVLFSQRSHPALRDLPLLFLTGFLAVPVTFLLQFYGLSMTTISRASLIIGAGPPLLAMGGMLFFGERPGMRIWIAIVLSMLGILAISGSPGSGGSWLGDGFVLLSIITSMVWVIIIKRLSTRLSPLVATSYMILFGTITLVPFTVLGDGFPKLTLPVDVWLSIIVLGVFCTALAFVLWNWGLERYPASRAGVFLNIEPVVGALLGVMLWRESLGAGVILGGALIIGAALMVSLANRSDSPSKAGVLEFKLRANAASPEAKHG